MPKYSTLSLVLIATLLRLHPAYATETRTFAATELISGSSQLNNSQLGKKVLAENLKTSIAINNHSTADQRARAISDNTIAALIGSMNNGLLVSNALGKTMGEIFSAHNAINAANYSASTFSPTFGALFLQVNTLIQADSSFAKNYYANGSANGDPAIPAVGIHLPLGGIYNLYDKAYEPKVENRNTVGNSRPVQVAPDSIIPFSANDFFGVDTNSKIAILPTIKSNAAFPSGHAAFGFASSLLFAEMVPERFQEFLLRGSEYGNSRIVLGVHYALDVIGARIMSLYTMAQILNNNPDYLGQKVSGLLGSSIVTSKDLKTLMAAAQTDLRNLLEQGCQTTLAACSAADHAGSLSQAATNKADYRYRLTYGLSPIGPTDLAPVVPEGAEILIASRFPYLSDAQRREVLATTEIESGYALDNGSGWARLDLYTAAEGYGAINGDVSINMDAARGGFNAYDVWSNDIGGNGQLVKNGSGMLVLTGNNRFSGTTTVAGGALIINGYHGNSAVTVNNGALLGGTGQIGSLIALPGATLAPGHSIGTLAVENHLSIQSGAHYRVELAKNGQSDAIQSAGTAVLEGGEVKVILQDPGNLLRQSGNHSILGQQYSILSAQQGIQGRFALASADYPFLISSLNYQPEQVLLSLQRNTLPFAQIAETQNGSSLAQAVESLGAGHPVYESVLYSDSVSAAHSAFRQLSGQIHADIASAQINESRYLRDILNQRLRQSATTSGASDPNVNQASAWAQLIGAWQHASGNTDVTGYQSSHYGILLGLDTPESANGRVGITSGFTTTRVNGGNNAKANSDNYHLGIYGARQWGRLALQLGSSYTWHRINTSRNIHYASQADSAHAKYRARTEQLFAETGYNWLIADVSVEPFANLAYINFKNQGIDEQGGSAALRGDKQHTEATVSTFGVRAHHQWRLYQSSAIRVQGELGWQHQYGEQARSIGLMFHDSTVPLQVNTVPASRDGAVLKATTDVAVGSNTTLSLGYAGLVSKNHQDNRVNAGISWRF